ncbi:TIGR03752 family integrating conjugative element protein [Halomonas halodenitrificans]|uniref:TIGR03752 family integrating conjugative element protein n=1 Tax=Halomonas halodenitrificans TaxID=28252 RepID=UPI0004826C7D|nr:TIGR03752 family integrating conjugative element protein [Halomonas halodenitrificans]
MTQRSNTLLKVLVPALLVIVLLIVVRSLSGGGAGTDAETAETDPTLTLNDDELQALGIEGDTPRDTVATLVGHVQAMRRDLERAQAETQALRDQNERLMSRDQDVDGAIEEALRRERERLRQEVEQTQQSNPLLSTLQRQLDQLRQQVDDTGSEDLPIGLGLEGGGGHNGTIYSGPGSTHSLTWVEPLDAQEGERGSGETAFPTRFGEAAGQFGEAAQHATSAVESRVTGRPDESSVEPVYTLPENSTLMGSVAMTALLGRVPIDGTVNDPYPFKVVIGRENLTANGVTLPEVESAIVSGTATGDWTLSCVRGQVNSMTFVFEDGTVRTLPTPDDVNSGDGSNRATLGWLSDPRGLPCIPGDRKTNAQQFLLTSFILGAAEAGADAMAMNEVTTSVDSGGVVSGLTGDSGRYAASQALAGGVSDVRQWVQERFGQTFDAVYVPPGQPVAIHIERELPIDYETQGRRVRYDRSGADNLGLP